MSNPLHNPQTGKTYDLALVMPVYNEEACIGQVVASWRAMLEGVVPRFKMIVLNDGSRDRTAQALEAFQGDPRVQVINKPNSGHGPTILQGYRQAVGEAEWVFQTDSDDEMKPDSFPPLWSLRERHDFLFCARGGREQSLGRKLISLTSRTTVRLLFGRGVRDVNVPYRLMRAEPLARILRRIPEDTFAPNIIISGLCARAGCRIYNTEAPHTNRRTGTVSIVRWKLWKAAGRAFLQTLRAAMNGADLKDFPG